MRSRIPPVSDNERRAGSGGTEGAQRGISRVTQIEKRFIVRAASNGAGMALLFAATVMPQSTLGDAVRYAGMACITVLFVLRAGEGYMRRRPYWTHQSWRRYLLACCIPGAALLILAGMLVALEWRLPIVGPPQSGTRTAWAAASLVFMLIGAGGLAVAVGWLADGEPSRQMGWPKWLDRV